MKTRLLALALITVASASCKKQEAKADNKPAAPAGNRVAITVTEDGFQPDDIKVKKGEPMTFVFERKTDKTCAKEVIIHIDEGNEIEKKLPLNEPVEVAVTFPKSGEVVYACGMDMVKGSIHVQ
jgi:plastocyanin domain-containing protein